MSLQDEIKQIQNSFDTISSEQIIKTLNQIKPHFKSTITSEYLDGKIQKILDLKTEPEKKEQCKALFPYFDWYLQGQ